MMSEEEQNALQDRYALLNEQYTRLRSLYLENHFVWEATERQNVELRAALHNMGG